MKKRNDLSLQEALQEMLRELRLASPLNESRVRTAWERLMGKTISTYTSDLTVRKGVLYVTIVSAPLKHELSFGKEKIRRLINEELGEEFIQEVVIR